MYIEIEIIRNVLSGLAFFIEYISKEFIHMVLHGDSLVIFTPLIIMQIIYKYYHNLPILLSINSWGVYFLYTLLWNW